MLRCRPRRLLLEHHGVADLAVFITIDEQIYDGVGVEKVVAFIIQCRRQRRPRGHLQIEVENPAPFLTRDMHGFVPSDLPFHGLSSNYFFRVWIMKFAHLDPSTLKYTEPETNSRLRNALPCPHSFF